MKIVVSATVPKRRKQACLVVAIHHGGLRGLAADLDASSDGALSRAIEREDAGTSPGSYCLLYEVAGIDAVRLLLVGAGDRDGIDARDYRKLCTAIGKQLSSMPVKEAILAVAEDVTVIERRIAWRCEQLLLAISRAAYRFTRHKGSLGKHTSAADAPRLDRLTLLAAGAERKMLRKSIDRALATSLGVTLARDLGNTAPNVCTPSFLADTARELAQTHENLKTVVLDEARMKRLGMGAFLSVAQGSREPACLVCMEYRGAASSKPPIVLVGKGITFDTGGISIKPSASLDEMKFDMCGAASVFGVMRAVAELQPARNVIGVVAAAENMPDGDASRPGDVVTTLAGITVEILNTDAEGRLVLCDTLSYVKRYKPAAVIDMATLTGAAVVALGHVASALFSNDEALASELQQAADHSCDLAWRLPLYPHYHAQLDSPFADLANIGARGAGAITAACFLSRFAEDYPWAHLDIAGTASTSGSDKGATGRPVPLLMEYLFPDTDRNA